MFYYLIYTGIVLYLCCQYIDECYECFFWLPGVLEKVGVEPQVQRIGKYKSAGDQLSRKEMSEANREMLTALLDDIYANFLQKISSSTGY
jgi:ClpP class serine protease